MAKRKPDTRGKRGKRAPKEKLDTQSSSTAVREETSSADNDPSWYALTPALLKDAASLPFSQATGLPFRVANTEGSLPGVMALSIRTVPGTNDYSDSPINVASRNIYSWVRHANSGSRNYDSPNLMMYLMAMDSLFAIYSHCARMYGLLRVYAQKNRNYPRAFFDLVGWDYDDFVANMASFRLWLNTFVERVGSMCVPANMTFMLRHMWMFQHVWLDGPTTKAQSYFFYPQEVLRYMYDKDDSEFPIKLESMRVCPGPNYGSETPWKVTRVTAAIDDCIRSILEREDLAIMSGDILKAYGSNGIWKLVPIHEDFVVLPTFSQEVMYQIHNSTCCVDMNKTLGTKPNVYIAEYADTTTNTTWLKTMVGKDITGAASFQNYHVMSALLGRGRGSAGFYYTGQQLLNFHHEDVTPEDVMVATRLSATYDMVWTDMTAANKAGTLTAIAGSEVVTGRHLVRYVIDATSGKMTPQFVCFSNINTPTVAQNPGLNAQQPWVKDYAKVASLFEYAPIAYDFSTNVSSKDVPAIYDTPITDVIGSLENYTTVDFKVLSNMHLAALMSEFYVPQMGAVGNHIAP